MEGGAGQWGQAVGACWRWRARFGAPRRAATVCGYRARHRWWPGVHAAGGAVQVRCRVAAIKKKRQLVIDRVAKATVVSPMAPVVARRRTRDPTWSEQAQG